MSKFIEVHQFYRNPDDGQEATIETMINVADLRTFYARRLNDAQPGTRLTFVNGHGFAISENVDDLRRMASEAGFEFIPATIIAEAGDEYFEEEGESVEGDVVGGIAAQHVRCYYPRKNGKPGTRVTFVDGGGFAIREAYADFKAAVSPVAN